MGKAVHALNLLRFACGSTQPITGPAKVAWDVTYRCNLRCKHCHLWQIKDHNDLDTEEAKKFIADIADLGTLHLSFSGGEPFLRRDLVELISFARDAGLSTGVNTNGTRLVDPEHAKAACRSGLGEVFVSLDGPDAETHNSLRGMDHAFSSALRAIDNLLDQRDAGKPAVFVNTTVTKGNAGSLDGILELAKSHGVDGMTLSVIQSVDTYSPEAEMTGIEASGLGRKLRELTSESDGLIPHPAEYLDCFQTYLEKPSELYRYRCAAGYANAVVQPNGDVFPCPVAFASMGNLREQSFKEIWYSRRSAEVRERIKANKHPICWFDCIAPLNVLLHNVRRLRIHKVLHRRTIAHILRKTR